MIRLRAITAATALCACVAVIHADVPKGIETFDAAWTIVRDTHFDSAYNGVDWNAVRTELRPRAEAAKTTGELRVVITAMLSRLGQSHFALVPSSAESAAKDGSGDPGGGSATPGFDLRLVGTDILVTGVARAGGAATAGVKPGWRLTAIAGRPVKDLLQRLPAGLNDRLRGLEAWRLIQSRLRGSEGSAIELAFEDGAGAPVHRSVTRQPEQGQPVTVGSLPTMFVRVEDAEHKTPGGRRAGLIGFNVWMPVVDGLFQKAVDRFRDADGIIIDLRGNPGGLAAMLMGISGHFVSERRPLGIMKTRSTELRFVVNPREVDAESRAVPVYYRPGCHCRGRDERQRLGMFHRGHAVDRPGARVRADDDGSGLARTFRQAAERRHPHPRLRRFRNCRWDAARGTRSDPRSRASSPARRPSRGSRSLAGSGTRMDRYGGGSEITLNVAGYRVAGYTVALPGERLIDCVYLHDCFSSPHNRP